MTTNEVKDRICQEFMETYREWLADRTALSDMEYGKKYGWQKSERLMSLKDNLQAVTFFQKYIFSGRWLPAWEKVGYDRKDIWELSNEGFLSYQYYSNWQARASGHTDFYYISQKTAKQIWRDHR